jgi:hypothetical protein
MKLRQSSTIKLIVLSLLFGMFTVPTTAGAVDTVTKTFTVRGANDALLVGAQVRFTWSDPITGSLVIGTPGTTNSSGVVALTAPLNAPELTYGVFPAVGDRVNALQKNTIISSSANGTVNVKLQAANLLINVQKSDGSNVTGGAVLYYPSERTHTWNRSTLQGAGGDPAYVIRSGTVGVRIASNLDPNSDYAFALLQNIDNYQPGQFSWRYGLKASGSAGSQSYTFYADPAFSGPTITPTDGVYVLRYSGANIFGTLKNNDGSTFTLSPGMTMNTTLRASGWSPAAFPISSSSDFTDFQKSPTPNWFARGLGAAGKYELGFIFGGSTTIPSFSTFVWKNSSGGWSLSETGPFVGDAATPAQLDVRRSALSANLALQVLAADTQADLPASLDVQIKNQDNSYSTLTFVRVLNGKFSAVMPNGEYLLNVNPTDKKYIFQNFTLVVNNGAVSSFKDAQNTNVPITSGVYQIAMRGPNVSGVFKDSSGADLVFAQNQWIDLSVQKKDTNGNWQWTNQGNRFYDADWQMGISQVGEYRFHARPTGFEGISDSFSAPFFLTAGNPLKISSVSAAAAEAGSSTTLTGLQITLRASNLRLSISDPRDNSLLKYGWAAIFTKQQDGNQTWFGNADIRSTSPGLADIRLDDGNYRIEINPQFNGTLLSGLARKNYDVVVSNSGANVAVTLNGVAISANSSGRFPVTANAANVTGKVLDQSGNPLIGTNDKWVSINVQKYSDAKKEFEWSSNWSNTDQNGDFSMSVTDPGRYRLRIQPTGFAGASIFYSQDFTLTTGSEKIAFGSLQSPVPTLSGIVYAPNGSTPVKDARVRIVNQVNNQELWQYESFTNALGAWSTNIPEGTYGVYAAAPNGSSSFGNSDKIGTVTVNSSGAATLSGAAASGRTASTFNISLKAPTWSGTVRNPGGSAVVPNAQVCLYTSNLWNCTDANQLGQWALSAPTGFSAFSQDSFVQIADWRGGVYPQRRFNDASTALGGLTASGRNLDFQSANVAITVTGANNALVPNVQVSLIRPNGPWLAGNNTNASGVALINIADLNQALQVRVEVGGNSPVSGVYASKVSDFNLSAVTSGTSNNVFSATIQLSAPNVTAVVREPNQVWASGAAVDQAWIEIFDADNKFISSTNTGSNGRFSLNAPAPQSGSTEYRLVVNPAWNSTSSFSKQTYTLTVAFGNTVTLTPKDSNTPVATNGGAYSLSLARPNVSGNVFANDVGVVNSWVVPIRDQDNEYMWQLGANTKPGGNFGFSLPDGAYRIDANLPWNLSGYAKPAQCNVAVANGVITSSASNCIIVGSDNQKTVKLALRTPNVTFTLKQNNQPVVGANVSIGLGNWNINAQTSQAGLVALFIDPVEIRTKTGLNGVQDLRVWVDPPWGTSDMVRWECRSGDQKPICSTLTDINLGSDTYATIQNTEVTVLGPNAKILIKDPRTNASIGANAWVSVFSYDSAAPQNGQQWVGGSNTDVNGLAAFYIETGTATTRFKVEVNPPWNSRVALAQKSYDNSGNGYTDADLKVQGVNFTLGVPNAVVTVKSPGGTAANKWGWIGLEEVNSSTNNPVRWAGGFGLNDTGTAAVTLVANKRYKLIANASNGRPGVQTLCYVETDSNIALSRVTGLCATGTIQNGTNNLTINLASGNTSGVVRYDNKPVTNAIVYANLATGGTDDTAIYTATLGDGSFGFDLDYTGGKQWVIKIFPFNEAGKTALANMTLTTLTQAPSPSLSVTLLVKQP